jgi:hypothetical protein
MSEEVDSKENGKMRKIYKFLKLEPGFPVFRQAIPAIYWPALGWLERHFAFLTAV